MALKKLLQLIDLHRRMVFLIICSLLILILCEVLVFTYFVMIFLVNLDNPHLMSRIKRNCSTPKRTSQLNNSTNVSLNIADEVSISNSSIFNNNIDCQSEEASTSSSTCISGVPAITGGGDRLITENGEQMMLVAEDELNSIVNELQALRIGQSSLHNKVGDLSRFK